MSLLLSRAALTCSMRSIQICSCSCGGSAFLIRRVKLVGGYPRLADENCYGRWGADHVIQRAFQGHEPFAAMLNRPESPVAGRIVSIQSIYQHSYAAVSNGKTYLDYDASAPAPFLEPFALLGRGSVTLFRIIGASSLLARELPSYPLGEGVQYVVFIGDAAAAHPLRELVTHE